MEGDRKEPRCLDRRTKAGNESKVVNWQLLSQKLPGRRIVSSGAVVGHTSVGDWEETHAPRQKRSPFHCARIQAEESLSNAHAARV